MMPRSFTAGGVPALVVLTLTGCSAEPAIDYEPVAPGPGSAELTANFSIGDSGFGNPRFEVSYSFQNNTPHTAYLPVQGRPVVADWQHPDGITILLDFPPVTDSGDGAAPREFETVAALSGTAYFGCAITAP
ncbi:MAG: hypothetical protein ACK5H2_05720 [Beutenbergiaceae bacterium]